MSDLLLQSSSLSLLGLLVVLLIIFSISYAFKSQTDGTGPPGPRPLPVLGNLLQLDLKRPYNTYMKLWKTYGSVFTVYFGPRKVVVLAGYKTVKEALVNYAEEFGQRDPFIILGEISQEHGVTWSNGASWKEMRRFSLTNLKDFGMGRKVCEENIIEECHHLIGVLKKLKGEAFDTSQPLSYAVSNIICSIVYGSRFEYDNPEFTSLVNGTTRVLQLVGSPGARVYSVLPWIGKWFSDVKELFKLAASNKKQSLKFINCLKETLNPKICRGFVDAFLVHKQNLEKSGMTNSHYHQENLLMTVSNIFGGATDTTSATLRWALILMAKHPKIQDQVQEELARVVGHHQIQFQDRKQLPFTYAVIHEIQRLANVSPWAVPHRTSRDVTFQGHFIKKGTTVFPFLMSVLNDETEWECPHSFNPAHFLDKDGKFVKRDAFMPFSAGRRSCIGQSLARMELFMFFSTLLQHFRFIPPPRVSEDDLSLTPRVGSAIHPSPHKLCAISRCVGGGVQCYGGTSVRELSP
ncbi:cytochrome P450 2K4-like [Thalassophryne amazonica]|uniref:cytochrome P450 2K4-like n=1 Tax=Thalassophryne amazonica TaxID=390379 RepID=UPI00147254EC|nr:cytochrome P450 2K4-like [Thalassophryne amazonica]